MNIWHPVNEVPTCQRKIIRFIQSLTDLALQITYGRDYYQEERLDRLDREYEAIKEMLRRT